MPETEATIWTALAQAKAEFPGLTKTAANPFFKSHYVPLEQVLDVIEPILAKYQLILIQEPTNVQSATGTRPALRTTLIYVPLGTERWSEMLVLPAKEDPQGQGAALTYARRYAIIALLGLNIEKDDDGETAQGRGGGTPTPSGGGAGPKGSLAPVITIAGNASAVSAAALLETPTMESIAPAKTRKPSVKQTAIQLRNEAWTALNNKIDEAAAEANDLPSANQKNLFHALLRGKPELATPDQQHAWLSEVTGRTIHSSTEMTRSEISAAIDLLKAS
jgi:hypothetical protein